MSRGVHSDPTAGHAKQNLEAGEKFAALIMPGPQRVWIDKATAREVFSLLQVKETTGGEYFGRIKENAPAVAAAEGETESTTRKNDL